jgi:salicylate hydroxylase
MGKGVNLRSIVLAVILCSYFWTISAMASVDTDQNDEDTAWGRAVEKPQDIHTSDKNCKASSSLPVEEVEVAVVGGGLVGLAVAIGLSRQGISCKVYERAPQLRSVSQGILCVQPNGMGALERIHPEIPNLVTKNGCVRKLLVHTSIDANGTVKEETKETDKEDMRKHGRHRVGITWHNMQQLLASLLPTDMVITGRSLSSFVEEPDSVLLYFENGSTVRAKTV